MKYFLLSLFFFTACARVKVVAPVKEKKFFQMSWAKNLDSDYVSGNLPISVGAPRLVDGVVYMGDSKGFMRAYDSLNGRVLWERNEGTVLGGAAEVFQDYVAYGGVNGRLFVRHIVTGELKYAIDLGDPIETAPVFYDGHLFVNLRGHQLVHLDALTGKMLWVYKRAIPITTTMQRIARPLIIGNKVIQGFADGYLAALSLAEGTVIWESKITEHAKFVDIDLNPIFINGVIVTGSPTGDLKAINPENGAISFNFGLKVVAHPMIRNQQLILGTEDGEVVISGLDAKPLKRQKISDAPISALAWWKDMIVAASFDGKVRAIDPLSMKIVDEFAMGYEFSSVFSDLPHSEQELVIYTSRQHLYLFK